MAQERKKILLIGEKPDIGLIALLQQEGYEIAALEAPYRAWGVHHLYQPHFIFVYLRYPRDLPMLEECTAMGSGAPVVAAISLLAKETFVKAVKEKAAALVILPAKPRTIREALGSLASSEDAKQLPQVMENPMT